ncbi:multidrug effflux MFS transporter [Streptomyces sp. JNUCC 64]
MPERGGAVPDGEREPGPIGGGGGTRGTEGGAVTATDPATAVPTGTLPTTTVPTGAAPRGGGPKHGAPDAPDALDAPGGSVPGGGGASAAARRTGFLVVLVLGGLTALPPLSMDMYLPALPQVTGVLGASAATVQLTLTACLAGMALGQLVVGPMSDKWGRRRPLMIGMLVYVLATAACAVAPTVETLIVFRLVQGLAGSAGIVIARAVVRDLYEGVAMARFFSTLMLISGVAPIIGPVIGAQVMRFTDWRGVFWVLAVVGVLLTLLVRFRLPETLEPARRHGGGVLAALRTMRGLLADKPFAGHTLAGGFSFAALFAYVSASPFVVQEIYGASPQTFSLLFGLNSVGLVIMGQINGRLLVGRVSLDRVLTAGLTVIALAALALLLITAGVFGETGLVPVATALFVLMSAMGLVLPNTNTLALQRAGHAAGSASALIGTSSFLIGAIASPLVGIAGEDTAVPLAVVQLVAGLAAIASFVFLARSRSGTA